MAEDRPILAYAKPPRRPTAYRVGTALCVVAFLDGLMIVCFGGFVLWHAASMMEPQFQLFLLFVGVCMIAIGAVVSLLSLRMLFRTRDALRRLNEDR